jgi:hypothetical protein
VQVAERFELARSAQRAGVDGAKADVLDEPSDRLLGVVVGGDEDVERLSSDLAARGERAGEGGVECLDDLRARRGGCDFLGPRPGLGDNRLEVLRVD